MPPLLQWSLTNVGASTKSSILTYPSTGRKSGRIDSILFSVDEDVAAIGGASLNSGFELLIDDILAVGTPVYSLRFQDANRWGGETPNLGLIKSRVGDPAPAPKPEYWVMAAFQQGLFRYSFEIKADNQDGGGAHDFFVIVTGEIFSVID